MSHKAKKLVTMMCKTCKVTKDCYKDSRHCRNCNREFFREYRKNNVEQVKKIRRKSRMRTYYASARSRLRDAANKSVLYWKQRKKNPLTPLPCEQCGHEKADAHHDSYKKEHWRVIRWLCRGCHEAWHSVNEPKYPDGI